MVRLAYITELVCAVATLWLVVILWLGAAGGASAGFVVAALFAAGGRDG
jgi:hypothetical protein